MEPNVNTNQPVENPNTQSAMPPTAPNPSVASTPAPSPNPTPTSMSQAPKGKGNKVVLLLIILLLFIIGMVAYILFAKKMIGNLQGTATDNSSVITPIPTIVPPTLAPENDIEVGSPEADLQSLETEASGL